MLPTLLNAPARLTTMTEEEEQTDGGIFYSINEDRGLINTLHQ